MYGQGGQAHCGDGSHEVCFEECHPDPIWPDRQICEDRCHCEPDLKASVQGMATQTGCLLLNKDKVIIRSNRTE